MALDPGPLAVVVVNYGSHALLQRNLAPLSRERPDLVIVVVDSYSDAVERGHARAVAAENQWVLVAPDRNIGFGAGVNAGVAEAARRGAESVLILNPDARIDAANLQILEQRLAEDLTAIITPRILNPNGSLSSAGVDLQLRDGSMRGAGKRPGNPDAAYVMWLSGACLLLSLPVWEKLGGFDEDYFLYWEDVDLCVRAAALGLELVVEPDARAIHDEGGTHGPAAARAGDSAKSPLYYYYNTRNRLLFAAKHLAPPAQRRWAVSSVSAAYAILLRGGRRQFLRPGRTVVPALRGTLQGLLALRAARGPSADVPVLSSGTRR